MADDAQIFRPYHVNSRAARLLIDGMFPGLIFVTVVFVIGFGLRIDDLIPDDATADQREAARPLMIALMALLATMPISLAIFWQMFRREIFASTLELSDSGVLRRKGRRERRCTWEEIEEIKTISIGRVQMASLKTATGRIRFDSSYVNADGPQPRRRLTASGEHLEYPDGSTRSLKITDNEAYQRIAKRVPDAVKGRTL